MDTVDKLESLVLQIEDESNMLRASMASYFWALINKARLVVRQEAALQIATHLQDPEEAAAEAKKGLDQLDLLEERVRAAGF